MATVSVNATQPLPAVAVPPAQQTAPILILDEDAFYHPAGRIRTMAEGTLDGFRPEPTLLVRLRQRRNTLSWVVLLVLAPVLLIALFAAAVVVGRATVPNAVPATTAPVVTTSPAPTMAVPALTTTAAATTPPTVAATSAATTPPTVAATSAARTTPAVTTPKASEQASVRTSTSGDATATPASNIPVFDVNSLKSVPALPAKTRR